MKVLGFGIAALLAATTMAAAQYGTYRSPYSSGIGSNPSSTYVQPRINNNGTVTGGHFRTTPNTTTLDNYGTRGNVNPYTGAVGTKRPGW